MKKTLFLFLIGICINNYVQSQVVTLDRKLTSWPDAKGDIVIPDTVESIYGNVFYYNKNIKSVVIPNSVKWIGDYAFYQCDSLITVQLPDGLTSIPFYCFYNCINLQNVQFGDSLRTIHNSAFSYCKSLKEIQLGNAVSLIGEGAFRNCSSLSRVKLGNNQSSDKMEILSLEYNPFYGNPIQDLELNKNIKQTAAFKNFTTLKTVMVGDSVTNLPAETFLGCTGLRVIRLSKTVRTVGKSFLQGCNSLESITVDTANTFFCSLDGVLLTKNQKKLWYYPALRDGNFVLPLSVDTIGDYAFSEAKKLTELFLPNSVTIINNYAFSGCTGLKTLEIGRERGTPIPKASIQSTSFNQCTSLSYIRLNKGLTYTGDSPFKGKTSLDSVSIGKQIGFINGELFSMCTSLKKVAIGDGTSQKGDSISTESTAFQGCTSLSQVYLNLNIGVTGNYYSNLFSMIDSLIIGPSVSSIGYRIFNNNKRLRTLRLPNNVTYLGNSAFSYCDSLRTVQLSESLDYLGRQCFNGCTSLKYIKIPTKIKQVLSGTFSDCSSLESVIFGGGITTIQDNAFSSCSSLTTLNLPISLQSIGAYAFSNCIGIKSLVLHDIITKLNNNAFDGCKGITRLLFGTGITTIPKAAFSNCTSLDTLFLPNSITLVAEDAFKDCTGLKCLIVGNSTSTPAKTIGFGAYPFPGCTKLERVEINRDFMESSAAGPFVGVSSITTVKVALGVTLLPNFAFYGCSSLKSIEIPNTVKHIGYSAFIGCSKLTSVKLPNQLTTIKSNLFGSCTSMKQFHLPESIESIENYGFGGCISMDSITLPNQLQTVGYGAFRMCTSLRYVNLPKSLTVLGERAFDECSSLNELWSKNPIPPSASVNCFLWVPVNSCILYVPKGSKAAYQNAEQWKRFNNIQEFESVDIKPSSMERNRLNYYSDKIIVSTMQTTAIDVILTNLQGHQVWKGTLDGSVSIPTTTLPSGMYLLNGKGLREKIILR